MTDVLKTPNSPLAGVARSLAGLLVFHKPRSGFGTIDIRLSRPYLPVSNHSRISRFMDGHPKDARFVAPYRRNTA
jgi:hypothetical protein